MTDMNNIRYNTLINILDTLYYQYKNTIDSYGYTEYDNEKDKMEKLLIQARLTNNDNTNVRQFDRVLNNLINSNNNKLCDNIDRYIYLFSGLQTGDIISLDFLPDIYSMNFAGYILNNLNEYKKNCKYKSTKKYAKGIFHNTRSKYKKRKFKSKKTTLKVKKNKRI